MRSFYYPFLTILFFVSFESNAQGLLMDYIDPQYQNSSLLYHNKYDKIDGEPYYLDSFSPSKVVLSNTKSIDTLLVKLDLFENNIVFLVGKKELVMDHQFIKSVSVFNSTSSNYNTFKYFKLEGNNTLAEVLTEGKRGGFYKVYKKKLVKPSNDVGYGAEASEKKSYISTKESYLITVDSKVFELSKLSNKLVADCFSNPDFISEYIKQNGLNCKKEEDVKMVISYYDQIN